MMLDSLEAAKRLKIIPETQRKQKETNETAVMRFTTDCRLPTEYEPVTISHI